MRWEEEEFEQRNDYNSRALGVLMQFAIYSKHFNNFLFWPKQSELFKIGICLKADSLTADCNPSV